MPTPADTSITPAECLEFERQAEYKNESFLIDQHTENYDRGLKAEIYREIPSLQELLLISQDRFKVELYRREPDGGWRLEEAKGLDASIELKSIAYTLRLSGLYKRLVQQA